MNIQQARILTIGQTVFVYDKCYTVKQIQKDEYYENGRTHKLISVTDGKHTKTLKSTQIWLTPRG